MGRQRDAVMTFEEERERLECALSDAQDALGRAERFARATNEALAEELAMLRSRLLELYAASVRGEADLSFLVCRYHY